MKLNKINGHIHNVVSTLPNVVKNYVENDNVVSTLLNVVQINVEIDNIDSTLLNVVNSNVDIHNIVSTLIWRCARRCASYQPKNNAEIFAGISCLLSLHWQRKVYLENCLTFSFCLLIMLMGVLVPVSTISPKLLRLNQYQRWNNYIILVEHLYSKKLS